MLLLTSIITQIYSMFIRAKVDFLRIFIIFTLIYILSFVVFYLLLKLGNNPNQNHTK